MKSALAAALPTALLAGSVVDAGSRLGAGLQGHVGEQGHGQVRRPSGGEAGVGSAAEVQDAVRRPAFDDHWRGLLLARSAGLSGSPARRIRSRGRLSPS